MSKSDLAERLERIVHEIGHSVLNDQRVTCDVELVNKTYAALTALVDLHNSLDPEEELVWE